MRMKRVLILGLLVATSAWSASCKSEGGDDGPHLLFGTPEGIVEYSMDAGEQRVLIASPSKTDTLRDPAVSPDGRRIDVGRRSASETS